MSRTTSFFKLMSLALIYSTNHVYGDASGPSDVHVSATTVPENPQPAPVSAQPAPIRAEPTPIPVLAKTSTQELTFNPFTGKILKNKVRMRLQPSLDGSILREMKADDLVIVVGEKDNFYAVQPPRDIKGYVFRTFVLDGVIEGSRVNVRLEPDLTAPVIAQMNTGDNVVGTISAQDKKWMEIAPPASTRFYIAKEFVEKIGDVNLMNTLAKRQEEADALIETATANSKSEMEKPFDEINLYNSIQDLNIVVTQYKEFPESVAKAKELIGSLHDEYAHKKEAHLAAAKTSEPTSVAVAHESKSVAHEPILDKAPADNVAVISTPNAQSSSTSVNGKMAAWIPVEQDLYELWSEKHPNTSIDDFYQHQSKDMVTLRGIIEPYTRFVKNKPGDYILVNQANHLPIAYLYSTKVNLQDKVGQEITVSVLPRDNHNFAFPAYFVNSVD